MNFFPFSRHAAFLLLIGIWIAPAFRLLLSQVVPHNQDRPPGPALSPEEARQKMAVPEGFRVELVASEPDIVNPVSMTFDERGRIWITESLEYPRSEPGPGQDRIKILEDTNGDGKADRFKIFAEGLNIPSGLAIGHGGVFVANSPDILFLEDTDGDDRADRTTVILTGFGRFDTHELPSTLTWGPDGWLYGLNGVFNPARVVHKGKERKFTCALWRYHPRTRDFELFAEGTSNPWGLAFDREGSAFVEACVIDHLYHLAETGYYHRQAGEYPPFTWKIESIVQHHHQKAAYCALDIYDAAVYPEKYRGRIFMGNLHGNCINRDRLERDGSTYRAEAEPDFLSAGDVWFMPVAIKLGPDGCFYVLDWYDRYHCYQDARRDPKGIDRLKGRLWRVAYGEAPPPPPFNLKKEPSARLVSLLGSDNSWWRREARRQLSERRDPAAVPALKELALGDDSAPRPARLEALWTLVSWEEPGQPPKIFGADHHLELLAHSDPGFRAWSVRAAGNFRQVSEPVRAAVFKLARDPSPDVRLQVAIAARKLAGSDALPVLLEALAGSSGDPLIPRIVWRNLEPLLEKKGTELGQWLAERDLSRLPAVEGLLGRMVQRLLAAKDPAALASVVGIALGKGQPSPAAASRCLQALFQAAASGEISAAALARLRERTSQAAREIIQGDRGDPRYLPSVLLLAAWGDAGALAEARQLLAGEKEELSTRALALEALVASKDPAVLAVAEDLFKSPAALPPDFLRELLSGLGKLEPPEVASVVLAALDRLPKEVGPLALDLLTQRPAWAAALLDAVEKKTLDSRRLNVTQVQRIVALGDEALNAKVKAAWGALRAERDPDREKVMRSMRQVLAGGPGDPWAGKSVFEKQCQQCHKIFGSGSSVGPDITEVGRETLDLLLSNLLDPNLVIGKDYYVHTVLTRDQRVLSGLLVEDSPQRVVLKVAGGKEEVVARKEVRGLSVSSVSLMPEELEKTMTEEEFRDLIAFLRYDEAPPPPAETVQREEIDPEKKAVAIEQRYGELRVLARVPGSGKRVEVLRFRHSNDGRPFLARLSAPGGGPILASTDGAEPLPPQGLFTAHPDANGLDFWSGPGWTRSRGLAAVLVSPRQVEFTSRADWLAQRLGGERLLAEELKISVPAPEETWHYAIEIEWKLTALKEVTFRESGSGGLVLRLSPQAAKALEPAAPDRPWREIIGRFGEPGIAAGASLLEHPENPNFPAKWHTDARGLVSPALTAGKPFELAAGKTAIFRYRLIVWKGEIEAGFLPEEYKRWLAGPAAKLNAAGGDGK